MECVFCRIVNGELEAKKVWEDEHHIAFLDINPLSEGHTLVIPKKHRDYLFDMEDKEYCELLLASKKVAQKLKNALSVKRVGVMVEGFLVPHVHIHLIPMNKPSDMRGSSDIPPLDVTLKKLKE